MSLDEQLALFESEISSLVSDEPGPSSHTFSSSAIISAPPTTNMTSTSTSFVPHAITVKPTKPSAPPKAPATSLPPSAVIESAPVLFNDDARRKAERAAQEEDEKIKIQAIKEMRSIALPSDIELAAARKTAIAAQSNSYLGAVLRGEKKMKRFVRAGGGQVWDDPSLAEWDPNDYRIFCGDLGNEVSDELLAKAFRKYPSFQKAKVVRDGRTNKPKGYGFVSFKVQDDFVRAMREMDGKYVGNRPIKLRKSNWKDRNIDVVKKKEKMKKKLGLI